jgi:DNA recombination protein RmuC
MEPLAIALVTVLALATGLAVLWGLRERFRLTSERDLARARLTDEEAARSSFRDVAGEVLKRSNEEFLELAQERLATRESAVVADMEQRRQAVDDLIKPVTRALEDTHRHLRQTVQDHAGLREQVQSMNRSNSELRTETSKLVQALRKPNVRGRYGEIQLERVVELAGMRAYCDFTPQENLRDEEGQLQKPDLVVRLPNERMIAIDAKVALDSYLDAVEAPTDERRDALLDRYAQNVLEQVAKLAKKQYWANFDHSPEIVVLFVPGDQLVDAALERRPELIERAAEMNVIIASPSTLIGLLRAVHVGWREKNLTDSAEELFELGRELHKRAAIVLEKAGRVGDALDGARKHYNEFVGSVQGRLLPALRKFEERDARSARELTPLHELEGEIRELDAAGLDDEIEPAPRATAKKARTG